MTPSNTYGNFSKKYLKWKGCRVNVSVRVVLSGGISSQHSGKAVCLIRPDILPLRSDGTIALLRDLLGLGFLICKLRLSIQPLGVVLKLNTQGLHGTATVPSTERVLCRLVRGTQHIKLHLHLNTHSSDEFHWVKINQLLLLVLWNWEMQSAGWLCGNRGLLQCT